MIAPRLLPLWIKIVLRSRIKIQLAKNSTCSRAILDLLHSIFLNVANCTRCARAILQHLKKSRAINPESHSNACYFMYQYQQF